MLRPPTDADLDAVLAWRNHPGVTRWLLSSTTLVASWRVMEKAGMRREQHGIRDSWYADLGWIDGYTYAVLADERR